MNFPITYCPNFFSRPEEIIELSKTLDYHAPGKNENWKGLRSKSLHLIKPDLSSYIINKVLSLYYDFDIEQIKWDNTYTAFQKMNDEYIDHNDIHTDEDSELAGIIYLNKNSSMNNGTSVYNDRNRIISVSNEFNSLLCYDSKFKHSATDCIGERLNIVFFVDTLQVKKTPLDRFRRVNLNYDF